MTTQEKQNSTDADVSIAFAMRTLLQLCRDAGMMNVYPPQIESGFGKVYSAMLADQDMPTFVNDLSLLVDGVKLYENSLVMEQYLDGFPFASGEDTELSHVDIDIRVDNLNDFSVETVTLHVLSDGKPSVEVYHSHIEFHSDGKTNPCIELTNTLHLDVLWRLQHTSYMDGQWTL